MKRKAQSAETDAAAQQSDVVLDAVAIANSRQQQEAADDAAWRHDIEAVYAMLLLRSANPDHGDAVELSHCIEDLKLKPAHVQRDQQAISEFRRHLSLHGQRVAATQAVVDAVEARKATEKRHKQEALDAIRACEHARRHSGDCGHASSAMMVLEERHPHLAAAFAAIRAD